jgi:hypothetical protein
MFKGRNLDYYRRFLGVIVMPDMSAIGAVATSLNTAVNIAKAMIELRDWSTAQGKVIELQQAILGAQDSLFAANQERAALVESVSDLEKEVTSLKAWETEKKRYQLEQVFGGAFAYVLKEETRGTEPIHWICTACYESGKKSILQAINTEDRKTVYRCPVCTSKIRVRYDISPGHKGDF